MCNLWFNKKLYAVETAVKMFSAFKYEIEFK